MILFLSALHLQHTHVQGVYVLQQLHVPTPHPLNLLLEKIEFLLLLSQQGVFGVLVNLGSIFDLLSLIRILQGLKGFTEVLVAGADVGYHQGLTVTPQGIRKQFR